MGLLQEESNFIYLCVCSRCGDLIDVENIKFENHEFLCDECFKDVALEISPDSWINDFMEDDLYFAEFSLFKDEWETYREFIEQCDWVKKAYARFYIKRKKDVENGNCK